MPSFRAERMQSFCVKTYCSSSLSDLLCQWSRMIFPVFVVLPLLYLLLEKSFIATPFEYIFWYEVYKFEFRNVPFAERLMSPGSGQNLLDLKSFIKHIAMRVEKSEVKDSTCKARIMGEPDWHAQGRLSDKIINNYDIDDAYGTTLRGLHIQSMTSIVWPRGSMVHRCNRGFWWIVDGHRRDRTRYSSESRIDKTATGCLYLDTKNVGGVSNSKARTAFWYWKTLSPRHEGCLEAERYDHRGTVKNLSFQRYLNLANPFQLIQGSKSQCSTRTGG